ncbi:hypothetical protein [Bradyrhizobium tropiciagri]|uniref:hypothetical protein n=1 Tax=Bradyrhizobium tropiciagri TaxID=312253 RepID=UPI0012FF42E2|nr:hypothetical protein [Bradyrhizobium tropiciagri]
MGVSILAGNNEVDVADPFHQPLLFALADGVNKISLRCMSPKLAPSSGGAHLCYSAAVR